MVKKFFFTTAGKGVVELELPGPNTYTYELWKDGQLMIRTVAVGETLPYVGVYLLPRAYEKVFVEDVRRVNKQYPVYTRTDQEYVVGSFPRHTQAWR